MDSPGAPEQIDISGQLYDHVHRKRGVFIIRGKTAEHEQVAQVSFPRSFSPNEKSLSSEGKAWDEIRRTFIERLVDALNHPPDETPASEKKSWIFVIEEDGRLGVYVKRENENEKFASIRCFDDDANSEMRKILPKVLLEMDIVVESATRPERLRIYVESGPDQRLG